MRPLIRFAWVLILAAPALAGCKGTQVTPGQFQAMQAQRDQHLAQAQQWQQRANALDANNRDLHTQLAQSEQYAKIKSDEAGALRTRLDATVKQLAETAEEFKQSQGKVATLQAAARHRGGAIIAANRNPVSQLDKIEIPGVVVRQEQGLVKIEMPADKLFLQGTAALHRDAFPLLDRVARAVIDAYPTQTISIEGHTDNSPVAPTQWRNAHQLSTAQAVAIFEQLTMRHRISPNRLRVAGYGPNAPLLSNGTPGGQARNRRIELVIHPAEK